MESFVFGDPWNPRRTHYAAPRPNPKPRVGSDAAAEVAPEAAAAVRIQRVFRGFLVRRNVDRVRRIAAEADEAERRIAAEAAAIRGDARERLRASEMLMGLLLRLDSVREVREYRKKVIRRVIALQEAVDSISAANSETLVEVELHDLEEFVEGEGEKEEAWVEDAMDESPKRSDLYVAESLEDGTNHEEEEEEEEEESEDEEEVPNSASTQRSPESGVAMGEATPQEEGRRWGAMERLVAELCKRSAEQCRILEGLVERVGRLERALRRMEKKKKTTKQSGHNC